MKQFERTYENIDFILFKAYYIEGKSVDVAVSLREQDYMIEYIGADNRVEDTVDFTPIRKSKAKKFREFLKEIKLLDWPTIKIGNEGYYDALLIFSCGYDEEAEEGIDEAIPRNAIPSETMRRVHKEIEQLIGTTFGSYRFYDK
ncbi:hypothetical protein SUT007_08240 [Streptococcus parasuis]|nr:hypothetical protein SUT007_08240 [Streptococcus parasuis]